MSEILTIANLRHAASRFWTCAEPEFRQSWMKVCSSDNHYTTAPNWRTKKLTCSNWSLKVKLWIERKYTIKLIPVKSYKKATVFVAYGKVTGRYHKSFPKPSKGVCIIAIPFKGNANASLCFNAMFPSILESSRLVRNLPPQKKETKKDLILQTNTVKFIICL